MGIFFDFLHARMSIEFWQASAAVGAAFCVGVIYMVVIEVSIAAMAPRGRRK